MIRLYDYTLSGNCYKLRLLLHWLGLDFQVIPVDFHPGRAHKSEWFLQTVNPLGQLPVLDDDGFVLRDAQACLVYLASRYDAGGHWYPDDAQTRGRIQLWLAAADDLTRSVSAARLHYSFGYPADIAQCERLGHATLQLLDDTLAEHHYHGRTWLAGGDAPSIADIACFPYAALAGEARLELRRYPALQAWMHALRHRPGFIAMPGIIDPAL